MERFKDDAILRFCTGKKVLHIGATDYPYHIEKAKKHVLLHQKLNEVATEVLGLDISGDAIRDLRQFGIDNIEEADIMEPLGIPSGHYDVIVAGDVVEHLANPGIALTNLRDIMNGETELIVTTPNCYCFFNVVNFFRKKETVHPGHFFWPSRQTMTQLFDHLGFQASFLGYVNFGSYSNARRLKHKMFVKLVLNRIPKIRSTLLFVLKHRH